MAFQGFLFEFFYQLQSFSRQESLWYTPEGKNDLRRVELSWLDTCRDVDGSVHLVHEIGTIAMQALAAPSALRAAQAVVKIMAVAPVAAAIGRLRKWVSAVTSSLPVDDVLPHEFSSVADTAAAAAAAALFPPAYPRAPEGKGHTLAAVSAQPVGAQVRGGGCALNLGLPASDTRGDQHVRGGANRLKRARSCSDEEGANHAGDGDGGASAVIVSAAPTGLADSAADSERCDASEKLDAFLLCKDYSGAAQLARTNPELVVPLFVHLAEYRKTFGHYIKQFKLDFEIKLSIVRRLLAVEAFVGMGAAAAVPIWVCACGDVVEAQALVDAWQHDDGCVALGVFTDWQQP